MQGDESPAATTALSDTTRNMIRFLGSVSSLRREEQSINAIVGVDAWQSALAVDLWAYEAVVAVLKLKITKQRTAPAR
jgi:hypothetical protein